MPPLADPLGAPLPPTLHLNTPWLYLVLAPAFSLWDGISMLSLARLEGLLWGLLVFYLVWRIARTFRPMIEPAGPWPVVGHEFGVLAAAAGAFLLFVIAGALWHRPMVSLAGVPPDEVVVDYHSHTNVSHDVRGTLMRGYDVAANLRWHRRAGFEAVFITDHNTIAPPGPAVPGVIRCPGIEVSAWQAHIVLLGDSLQVDRPRYTRGLDSQLSLFHDAHALYGSLSMASLPEYREYQWERLDTLVEAGLDGFELVNAAPKANQLTHSERDSVIALARRTNRFLAGVSDHHGWGATSMVWNLVGVPGSLDPGKTCPAILARLREGFSANRIVERHHLRHDSHWPVWLTPLGVVWETWRSMGWVMTIAWLAWAWGIWAVKRVLSTRHSAPVE